MRPAYTIAPLRRHGIPDAPALYRPWAPLGASLPRPQRAHVPWQRPRGRPPLSGDQPPPERIERDGRSEAELVPRDLARNSRLIRSLDFLFSWEHPLAATLSSAHSSSSRQKAQFRPTPVQCFVPSISRIALTPYRSAPDRPSLDAAPPGNVGGCCQAGSVDRVVPRLYLSGGGTRTVSRRLSSSSSSVTASHASTSVGGTRSGSSKIVRRLFASCCFCCSMARL